MININRCTSLIPIKTFRQKPCFDFSIVATFWGGIVAGSANSAMVMRLPSQVVVLGVISLLTATSSAMIQGLLPVFLVVALGAPMASIGLIEGIAGAAMSIGKIFAGVVSDWVGRRKPLLVIGYGASAAVKLLFPIADTAFTVLVARGVDRAAKGVRDAPRDALLADITASQVRGSAFGLRAAFYTLGFVIGPLTAMGLMLLSSNDFRLVFWIALVPALVGILVLLLGVRDRARTDGADTTRDFFDRRQLAQLAMPFWWIVATASTFSLASFSQAFLVLKTYEVGVDAAFVPLIVMIMYVVFSAAAYPCGVLADHANRRIQLGLAAVILIAADLILAGAASFWAAAMGAGLWGLQMGLSYGLLKAAVAEAAPERLRATAFGIYDFVVGLMTFIASAGAGLLWTLGGSALTFGLGAVVAGGALIMVIVWPKVEAVRS